MKHMKVFLNILTIFAYQKVGTENNIFSKLILKEKKSLYYKAMKRKFLEQDRARPFTEEHSKWTRGKRHLSKFQLDLRQENLMMSAITHWRMFPERLWNLPPWRLLNSADKSAEKPALALKLAPL